MILQKGLFSDLVILEIYKQVNQEEYGQDSSTRIETLNTKRQEHNWNAKNTDKRSIVHPSNTKHKLTQEDQMNIELIKKIMTGKKTTSASFRSQDWKKVKVEFKKVNESLTNIPTDNITERMS